MNSAQQPSSQGNPTPRKDVPAFLTHGFRPFFLGAGLLASLAILFWMARYAGIMAYETYFPAAAWHSHEMLFGFSSAVIAGFLLTAVPNWTGCAHLKGPLLAAFFAIWFAGRVLMWAPVFVPGVVIMATDVLFVALLIAWLAKAIWKARAVRNAIFILLVSFLLVASFLDHAAALGWVTDGHRIAQDLGLGTVILLIVIVGGRVIPAFTQNALAAKGIKVREGSKLDALAIIASALAGGIEVFWPGSIASGVAFLFAAVCVGGRMWGWRTLSTISSPILWVLHLAYLWVVAGLAFKGGAYFVDIIPRSTALHALTAGAIGTMTLAMMTRAALGHTGRPLKAPFMIAVGYGLVSFAAVMRIGSGLAQGEAFLIIIIISGCLWSLAFLIFSVVYWPILTRPRN